MYNKSFQPTAASRPRLNSIVIRSTFCRNGANLGVDFPWLLDGGIDLPS